MRRSRSSVSNVYVSHHTFPQRFQIYPHTYGLRAIRCTSICADHNLHTPDERSCDGNELNHNTRDLFRFGGSEPNELLLRPSHAVRSPPRHALPLAIGQASCCPLAFAARVGKRHARRHMQDDLLDHCFLGRCDGRCACGVGSTEPAVAASARSDDILSVHLRRYVCCECRQTRRYDAARSILAAVIVHAPRSMQRVALPCNTTLRTLWFSHS